jgi:thioredoxin-like negative regulator of GroEL
VAIVGVLLAAGGFIAAVESRRIRSELEQALLAIASGAWGDALVRLEALAHARPGWARGEVDYLIGLCYWNRGQRPEAAAAFERVPPDSEFHPRSRLLLAEFLVLTWRFRPAEDLLAGLRERADVDQRQVLSLLVRLARMQARFDDVRSWLRASLPHADDPVPLLRQLWLLDRGAVPAEGLRENLNRALAQQPEDDRVWLGLARVATLEGRFDEAAPWLKRCQERRPGDPAVTRALIDWSRAAGRPDEASGILEHLGETALDPGDRAALVAWLARYAGPEAENRALECWLERAPRNPTALERLGALAEQAHDPQRAAEMRRRKAEADDALERYGLRMRTGGSFGAQSQRVEMTRLAEAAGRSFDALAWCESAAALGPETTALRVLNARLRSQAEALASDLDCERSIDPSDLRRQISVHDRKPKRPARSAFRDDAVRAGLRFTFNDGVTAIRQLPAVMSGGIGIFDFDGDGWLDVYCVQGGPFPPQPGQTCSDRLFHNRRDGTFEDVTASTGIAAFAGGYGHGIAVADYDNDGRPDVFVTRYSGYALYRNKGDGTFEDVTTAAGLAGTGDWPTSAAFADLDGDGDLDLYVCHYVKWDVANPKICRDPDSQSYVSCSPLDFEAVPDHVFRNDGGRFVDVTASAGIADRNGRGLGVVTLDFDADGKIDLFVSNDQSANYLFRNKGGFHFEEIAHAAGVAGNAAGGYQAGMGIACGDPDGDGWPDLAVTNFYGESASLYRNLGAGSFMDWTSASGLGQPTRFLLGFGAAFIDADNDGHLDFLTANGHLDPLPGTPYRMPVSLLVGDGTRFEDASSVAGSDLLNPRVGRGLAVGDLDNDGRVDALVVDLGRPLVFLHNVTQRAGEYIAFDLAGTRSARDAVGARIVVSAGGKVLHAWRQGGGSYLSASAGRVHLGLGSHTRTASVEVQWPSGLVQRFQNLKAGRRYLLREGDAAPVSALAAPRADNDPN